MPSGRDGEVPSVIRMEFGYTCYEAREDGLCSRNIPSTSKESHHRCDDVIIQL